MSMIDLDSVPDTDLQPGRYVAEVEDLELVEGRKAPQLLARYRLVEHLGRGVTDYLSLAPAALWRVRHFMDAFSGPRAFDPDDLGALRGALLGQRGVVFLGVEERGSSAGFFRVRRYAPLTTKDTERLARGGENEPF